MKHYKISNATLQVALEKAFKESQERPLTGILTLRPEQITFTQTGSAVRSYRHNPHIYEGKYVTATVNDQGTVRFNVRKDLAALVKNRSEVEREISKALDALSKL